MEERAKRPGTLAHCLSFAGARRGLVVASLLLAALSAAASFIPFVAIYFVIADVVAAYPDLAALDAGALAGCGLLAIAGVAADVGLYLAALLCSHAAAFDTQYRLKLGIAEHLGGIPYVLGKHSNPLYNKTAGKTANRPSLRTERKRSIGDSS